MLIVFAGLAGTGKTTLARLVARKLSAAMLRIDAIEAAVIRSGLATSPVGPIGYLIAHQIAAECLIAGTPVVVDAVNPVAEARAGWRELARAHDAEILMVEVTMSDAAAHRRRVEERRSDVPGLVVPTWEQILGSDYRPWDVDRDGERLVVDGQHADASVAAILAAGRIGRR